MSVCMVCVCYVYGVCVSVCMGCVWRVCAGSDIVQLSSAFLVYLHHHETLSSVTCSHGRSWDAGTEEGHGVLAGGEPRGGVEAGAAAPEWSWHLYREEGRVAGGQVLAGPARSPAHSAFLLRGGAACTGRGAAGVGDSRGPPAPPSPAGSSSGPNSPRLLGKHMPTNCAGTSSAATAPALS